MNLRVMRQIAADGLLLEWNSPTGVCGVTGFDVSEDTFFLLYYNVNDIDTKRSCTKKLQTM